MRRPDACAATGPPVRTSLRRVIARALIAAPRERVWARLCHQRVAPLPFGLDGVTSGDGQRPGWFGSRFCVRTCGAPTTVAEAPRRYGYGLSCPLLFRAGVGQVFLSEYRQAMTEVTALIEFRPSLPGTGWLALAILRRLLDTALLRVKREMETVDCRPS
jgi:hypothetical protein